MQVIYTAKKRHISLTALIDVVFILLMFFMLTTQFIQWQSIPLELNKNQASGAQDKLVAALIIDENGHIYLHGQAPTTDKFAQGQYFSDYRQQDFSGIDLSAKLKLHPHAKTTVKTLISALDHFKSLNIELAIGAQIEGEDNE